MKKLKTLITGTQLGVTRLLSNSRRALSLSGLMFFLA